MVTASVGKSRPDVAGIARRAYPSQEGGDAQRAAGYAVALRVHWLGRKLQGKRRAAPSVWRK